MSHPNKRRALQPGLTVRPLKGDERLLRFKAMLVHPAGKGRKK